LLLHWNRRVNLTAVREPRQMVRRLFGESLYLAEVLDLQGWLVDVGSGAGFPGLALKLAAPELRLTLVESRKRKCAFLKEVARACAFRNVDVVDERFETWVKDRAQPEKSNLITTRAVKLQKKLLSLMEELLAPHGKAVFLTTTVLAQKIQKFVPGWSWYVKLEVPGTSGNDVVLIGGLQS
jgi:16S rRNA (guanine527-N7)-methyltransferase